MVSAAEEPSQPQAIPEERQNVVLFVQGGAGDVLAATPMIRAWKKRPENFYVVVTSTYAQLLENNPHIDKLHPLKDPADLYERYAVRGKLAFFKKHFIYDHFCDNPRYQSTCLPEFICRCYDVEYDGGKLDYYPTKDEVEMARIYLSQFKKPVVLIHATGSIPSDGNPVKVHTHKDLRPETVNPVIQKYKDKFDFVQIGLLGEPVLPDVTDGLGMPMREALALIPLCSTYIFIESLFAHAADAFAKKGVVVCHNTDPEFFGHPNAINICAPNDCKHWPCNRPVGACMDIMAGYYNQKTRERPLWKCPDQVCARIPSETLEMAFVRAYQEQPRPAATLAEARRAP